ncbi:MAG: sulfatase [Akkermansiaceae bacterium]|nr:sulfatase [Akkermansiaceae bacterium]
MKHLILLLTHASLFTIYYLASASASASPAPADAGAPAKQAGEVQALTPSPQPNFIIIFTDDQGYQDLGCFGSEDIKTPHIDRMASEGRMLTSFYSANPVCSASRAALMTGCYPRRVLEKKTVLFPQDDIGLHPEETTIADMLKTKGYATACVGKWHLGHHPEFLPTAQGFDSYFGIPYSNDMSHPAGAKRPAYGKWDLHWSKPDKSTDWKTPLIENEKILEHPVDQRTITRRYTNKAIEFIKANSGRELAGQTPHRPFFLYLAHSMPHVPLYLPDELYNPDPKRAYISVIEHIDAEVGRILDTLRKEGLDKNTYVIFTSDNGPWLRFEHHAGKAKPLRNGKGSTFEGGMRVPCVTWAPGRIPANSKSSDMASTIDLLPTIASIAGIEPKTKGPIDGLNIADFLHAKSPSPRTEFLYYTSQIQCIRQGAWKLRQQGEFTQLFNLTEDIGESKNLAKKHPEKVAALKTRMKELDAKVIAGARPLGQLATAPK